ncbi:hypothetical protein [Cyanobium sp. WAJ14-Wanaka]|uniref:hypothetical protein n=1 Tax=Cyanobium sp. WAJ14-Wanaka TaxID=2823725 RepID=UPI0020CE5FEC|nr:hypothetical protein [Cyanobium sp. WAJ14-Wanaka]MCP9774319.1 hypothetical protein [Cyanobium sp. WAJ14-Wanaka]
MAKDESSRGPELLTLGWTAEEVRKYEELWEYRQRWGAINLELEDRQFLRKAEGALPKRVSGKGSVKKAIQDKAHYLWLSSYCDAMKASTPELGLAEDELGAWQIVLEEELRALAYYQPVLGLPDTIKAKELISLREQWVAGAESQGRSLSFDFDAPLEAAKAQGHSKWKALRPETAANPSSYLVLQGEGAEAFRAQVRTGVIEFIRSTFPSLKETDKPEPPADWQPAS